MDWIIPGKLALGSLEDGKSASDMALHLNFCDKKYRGDHVVNIPFPDEVSIHPDRIDRIISKTRRALLRHDAPVLFHCRLGVSRAPAILAAFLALETRYSYGAAMLKLCAKRPCVSPHIKTWTSILIWLQSYGSTYTPTQHPCFRGDIA